MPDSTNKLKHTQTTSSSTPANTFSTFRWGVAEVHLGIDEGTTHFAYCAIYDWGPYIGFALERRSETVCV